jgi:hypothetical protein
VEKYDRSVVEEIRADQFERAYVIRWLTRLISFGSENISQSSLGGVAILEDAASLLALFAGTAASGVFTRTFNFPLNIMGYLYNTSLGYYNSAEKVTVTLRDIPLESFDSASVGAQTWGSSCILAEMIAESPWDFGIFPRKKTTNAANSCDEDTFRALELGSGTGLASIVLAKVVERIRVSFSPPGDQSLQHNCHTDTIVATDFHPSVIDNLRFNYEANFPGRSNTYLQRDPVSAVMPLCVFVSSLDWAIIHASTWDDIDCPISMPISHYHDLEADVKVCRRVHLLETHSEAAFSIPPPLDREFDLIIGADIVYEHLHARWIRSCIERFLRKPPQFSQEKTTSSSLASKSSSMEPSFHLIIPLRKTHEMESRSVEDVFSGHSDVSAARQQAGNDIKKIATPELAILFKEDILCDAYGDLEKLEEVTYRHYRIGWM